MHSYDLEGRGRVFVGLFAVSILLVWRLDAGLGDLNFEPDWWLITPSFAGVYSLLYWIFDVYVWRLTLLRKLGVLNVPDLNGEWIGKIESSYGLDGSSLPSSVVILQRWSKMVVRLETEHSRSRSVAATLKTNDLPNPELSYLYINEPTAIARDTMNMHRGTAILELKDSALQGDYYTGRGRRQMGTIKLSKS